MAITQEAFAASLFNVGYHALAAALHCARTLPSDQPLLTVEQTARDQLAWIDQHQPEYEHSTKSAAGRRNTSIFAALAAQAGTVLRERQLKRRLERNSSR